MYGGDVSGVVRSLTILFVFAGGCASQQTETEEVELATMVAARWEVDASVDDSTSVYTGRSTSSAVETRQFSSRTSSRASQPAATTPQRQR